MTEDSSPAADPLPSSTFSDALLDALGRWQRGWLRNRDRRIPIAEAIEREALALPDRYRHTSGPLYRKRHLYRTADQRELVPLFLDGTLDEGSATSWSADRALIATWGDDVSFGHSDVAAGAIFRHDPNPGEVVLNIPALWADPSFETAVASYEQRGGAEAAALRKIGVRQAEVIMRAPLRLDEIVAFSRPGNFDSLAETVGASTTDERADLGDLLYSSGVRLEVPRELSQDAVNRVIKKVVTKIKNWFGAKIAMTTPNAPAAKSKRLPRQRSRLSDLVELAAFARAPGAKLVSWRRLPGPDRIMEARWSDGTVGYMNRHGEVWLG